MSWASIAANQCVSRDNLQDAVNNGVVTLKNAIPGGGKQITKAEAAYYVNLNQSQAGFAAKSNNQLIVKSNIQACTPLPYTYTLMYNTSDGGAAIYGFDTTASACSGTGPTITLYSGFSFIIGSYGPTGGTRFYTDPCGYDVFSPSTYAPFIYYKVGTQVITFSGTSVDTVVSCAPPPPTTFTVNVTNSSAATAELYVNGSYYATIGGSGITNTFTLTATGDIFLMVTGGYIAIDYNTNGGYSNTVSGYYSVSTPTISTSTGNTYNFNVSS